ncbi:hypothetical protein PR048_008179 [Dryococelus australis]|uniref:Uncharacterized protein n=1 Tax=Dryococelus australis TaxID=614101 RepID=A0ABQ9HWD2_9NEOP|nr:hypothetical protein PR048_008179 [Dryococelus australis]
MLGATTANRRTQQYRAWFHHHETCRLPFIVINLYRLQRKEKRRPRWWVKKTLPAALGITCTENNTNFVCMVTEDFDHVLKIIEPVAKKKEADMRDTVAIKERLLVSLTFLETGMFDALAESLMEVLQKHTTI